MTLRHHSGVSARRFQLAVIFSLLCACLIAWGCQTTPVSGRRKLVLVPETQELSLGEEAYKDILSKEQAETTSNGNSKSSRPISRTRSACQAEKWRFTKASFQCANRKPGWPL
jgi:hypothetical protein